MIKKILLLLFIILIWIALGGTETYSVNNLLNPSQIFVDQSSDEIFIVDGTAIHVFTSAGLKPGRTFGKQGEGPGELMPPVSIDVNPELILVNSKNKVSFFSRQFKFISEKIVVSGKRFVKTGEGFTGQGFKIIGQDGYETFNFYDREFSKGVEIVSRKSPIQRSGKIPVLRSPFIFRVFNNVVYYSFNDQLELGIYQKGRKEIKNIRMDYKNKPFTSADKAAFENYFKTSPQTRKNYEMLKQRLEYPGHYPAIRTFLVSDGVIYILTHRINENGLSEMLIFETNGTFVKRSFLPLKNMNIFRPYPFYISGSRLYQLVETEDEKWELHIIKI